MKTCKNCNKTHSSHYTWYQLDDGLYCSDKCVMNYKEHEFLRRLKEEVETGSVVKALDMIGERLK